MHCTASYASPKHHVLPQVLLYRVNLSSWDSTSACISWYESAEVARRHQSTTRKFSWCISFYGVMTNTVQQCNVRCNTCLSLAKNPSSCILSCAGFSKISFHLCLLQQNVLWHNWFSKEYRSFHSRSFSAPYPLTILTFLSLCSIYVSISLGFRNINMATTLKFKDGSCYKCGCGHFEL